MAFKDGSSSSSWAGFRWAGAGGTDQITLILVAPGDGLHVPSTLATLQMRVDNSAGAGSDLQVQVSIDPAFGSLAGSASPTSVANGPVVVNISALSPATVYYWRARASQPGAGSWGPWAGDTGVIGSAAIISALGQTITASSSNGGAWLPANAFNMAGGDDAWASASGLPQWLQVQFASVRAVAGYSVQARTGAPEQTPKDWTFAGSNNGSTWTTLDTQTGVTFSAGQVRTFTFTATPSTYTYYRINITAVGSGTITAITELTLFSAPLTEAAPLSFMVDLNTGRGYGYINENTGIDPNIKYPGDTEYIFENVGFPRNYYAGNIEYVNENVGFHRVLHSEAYEEVYEGDVSTHPPVPHVWFTWKPFGFVDDEVWTYGHGFGYPQAEYGGHHKIRKGPAYLPADDYEPVVNEWYLQEALPEAYGPDRKIYPGTETAEPIVNQQVEVIRWIAPAAVVPTVEQGAQDQHVYVSTTAGMSNFGHWLMYPTIPTPAAVQVFGLRTTTVARLSANEFPGSGYGQELFAYTMPSYTVSLGRAERMPILVAGSESSATLGDWSSEEALADALEISMAETRRWLPDEDTLVAHPEAGTGTVWWEPVAGDNTMSWRFESDSAPYIDPAYRITTRIGTKVVPAMIFPGDAWAQLTANLPAGPEFSIAIVAVLQAPPTGNGTILTTFPFGTADVGSQPSGLSVEGSSLKFRCGGLLGEQSLQRMAKRPVIITAAFDERTAWVTVLDLDPSNARITHPPISAGNSRLWLGRSNDVGDLLNPMAMDVLDIVYWNHRLQISRQLLYQSRLDGVYGMSQSGVTER